MVVEKEKKTHSSLSSKSKQSSSKSYFHKLFHSRSLAFILSAFLLIPISFLVLQALQQNPSFLSATTRLFTKSSVSNTSPESPEMASSNEDWKNAKTIYEFSAKDIDGKEVNLSDYKGRVVLIVNVACNCGFTNSNYPQMQELHRKYKNDGLSVLAFPCNQFGGQEPNPEKEIKEFVKQFDVEFEMFSKINVNGDGAHPLYKFLKNKLEGTLGLNFIKWNFSKFLIGRDGVPYKRYAPTTAPKDIEDDIVKLLKSNGSSS